MSQQRPDFLSNLPPLTHEVCMAHLVRENGYVTLLLRRSDGVNIGVFTLHRVEATKLAERLQELVDGSDGATSLVEGVHIGGPPTADQLMPRP